MIDSATSRHPDNREVPAVLEAAGISKRFGALEANRDVSLTLRAGEVHTLLGQNGAGKSTLIGVLAGRHSPDAGEVRIRGRALPGGKPLAALKAGIGVVYQELAFIPTMTGLENLQFALRFEPWAARASSLKTKIGEVAERFNIDVNLDSPMRDVSQPHQQRIALLRALCQEPRVLVLDEPTALLPPGMVRTFLEYLGDLAKTGLGVLFVTHRLSEMRVVSHRVTVLRRGRVVGTFAAGSLPGDGDLAQLLVGSDVGSLGALPDVQVGPPVLDVSELRCAARRASAAIDGVTLRVQPGEILGLGGVDGNGQEELLEAIAGLRPISSGEVYLSGVRITQAAYRRRRRAGVFHVSGDRQRFGIVPRLTVAQNLLLGQDREFVDPCLTVDRVGLLPPDPFFPAEKLSGGNQQKVLFGRLLQTTPAVVALSYPLRGLDIQASQSIRQLVLELAASGVAFIIAWSDLDELMTLCHRIVIMDRGKIVGEQERKFFDSPEMTDWFTTL